MGNKWYFTSESVTEGHPDKVCDQIADAILDEFLKRDKHSKTAIEVLATTGLVMVTGEVTSEAYVDIQSVVREVLKDVGYTRGKIGFDSDNVAVIVSLDEQSPDIAQGVKDGEGAGDQGLMFGFASTDTEELMPAPIVYAHRLTKRLAEVRKKGILNFLRPDGKSQVTLEYDGLKIKRIDNVVISCQHDEDVSQKELHQKVMDEVILKVLPQNLIDEKTKFFINPTGRFVIGGPKGDTGVTGRKIICDTYGGFCRHGGGAFSGKDATKVDRSAAYLARYIAVNLVKAGVSSNIEIGLSYAIGVKEPTSIMINTFGLSSFSNEEIEKAIRQVFFLTPQEIIDNFGMREPMFRKITNYGHFGRPDLKLPWEKLDKVSEIQKVLKIK